MVKMTHSHRNDEDLHITDSRNQTDSACPSHRLSIVIPLYNEAENVVPLWEQVHTAFETYRFPWELIFVDDGSSDDTLTRLKQLKKDRGASFRIVALQRNFGQTTAMQAGFDFACGDIIATMDGDLQNDPQDIFPLVCRLFQDDLDLIVGWRKHRRDKLILRKLPSLMANHIIRRVTGVNLDDYGCTLKIYRKSVLQRIRLYGEMHRFIPAWFTLATSPDRIGEMEVNHRPRQYGKSKYGLSRSVNVLLDLLAVYFFMHHRSKPGHFFGSIGLILGFIGVVVLGYLGIVKFGFNQDIGTRPLLLVGVVFVIASIQLLTTGVIAELMARTYFESSDSKPYALKAAPDEAVSGEDALECKEF